MKSKNKLNSQTQNVQILLIDMDGVLAENDSENFALRKNEEGFLKI